MSALLSPGRPANGSRTTRVYRRRRPERSALYRLVQQHLDTWPAARREADLGADIAPHQCDKLERLCRYITRTPVASERLALTASGHVRDTLKTPYRDGTTHLVLEPRELMARLAALVRRRACT